MASEWYRLCVKHCCEVRLLRIILCANKHKGYSYYNYWNNDLICSYRITRSTSPTFIPVKADKGFCNVSCFSRDNSNHSLLSPINSINACANIDCSKQETHDLKVCRGVLGTPVHTWHHIYWRDAFFSTYFYWSIKHYFQIKGPQRIQDSFDQ